MLFYSGIGTYLQNIIPRIAPFFEITLLTSSKNLSWNTNFTCFALDSPIYSWQEQLYLPRKIPSCDLFWSPHYNIPLLPIKAKKRAVTIHDLCHLACPHFFSKIKRFIARIVLQKALDTSDLVMTVSEFSKQEISRYLFPKHKTIHIIPNGVTKNTLSFPPKKAANLKRPFILFIGSHKPHKNAEALLKAFLQLPKIYDLVMVVPKENLIKHHPRVHYFHNLSREELSFLYEKASLLVQPSLYEGFGLVPLEAMEKGCPVVASDHGSLPEVCKDAALYINPKSITSIYEGMRKALEDPLILKDLIQKGYARANSFSWDSSAIQIKNLFLEALS